jgi:hypothetical protein
MTKICKKCKKKIKENYDEAGCKIVLDSEDYCKCKDK